MEPAWTYCLWFPITSTIASLTIFSSAFELGLSFFVVLKRASLARGITSRDKITPETQFKFIKTLEDLIFRLVKSNKWKWKLVLFYITMTLISLIYTSILNDTTLIISYKECNGHGNFIRIMWIILVFLVSIPFLAMLNFWYRDLKVEKFDSLGVRKQMMYITFAMCVGSIIASVITILFTILAIDIKYIVLVIQPIIIFIYITLFCYPIHLLLLSHRDQRSSLKKVAPDFDSIENKSLHRNNIRISLKNFLDEKINFNAMIKFLMKEMNPECASFLIEIENFKKTWKNVNKRNKDSKQLSPIPEKSKTIIVFHISKLQSIIEHANYLISTFVVAGSDLEMNISDNTRQIYTNRTSLKYSSDMFTRLEDEVYQILEGDAFERFKSNKETRQLYLLYQAKIVDIKTFIET